LAFLGYRRLHLRRRRAGLAAVARTCRKIDARVVGGVHPAERDDTRQRQRNEQNDRNDRIADRPGGSVPEVHWADACPPPSPATGLTRSPSLRKPPARTTIRSPPARPPVMAIP